jgi:hypothetical protein
MTRLEQAKELAAAGFHVFECRDGSKKPLHTGWQSEATRDLQTIRSWQVGCNFGIYTSKFGDGPEGLLVVDVDMKPDGKNGNHSLLALELQGFDLPETREASTPNGGRHLFFRVAAPVRQGANVLGFGLDIRSKGGYVLGAGSEIAGKQYAWANNLPIALAPTWLVERCGARREKAPTPSKPVVVDPADAERRAIEYLQYIAPATAGGRNDAGYKTAARLKDIGIGRETCLALMAERWQCEPPLDADELAHVVNSAFAYGTEAQGSAAPEADFRQITDPSAASPVVDVWPWVAGMNERYAITTHHGRTMVHEHVIDHELGHPRHDWLTFDDLKRRHLGEQVNIPKNDGRMVWIDKGTAWLEHAKRRQYQAEAFLPGQAAPHNVLNLWRGFAIEPKPGQWLKLRAHIRDIICAGDPAVFSYVLAWLARLMQQPGEQGQVALVLQGDEGTGKGTFGTAIQEMAGQHGLHISQAKHLTGAFNSHLRDKVFVFADESFFAGDPSHRGPLYALITEDKIQIEAKGVDAKTARNVLHIVMATNEGWAVPAGVNARRFCVLKLSGARRQDTAYFQAIRREMNSGGLAAMLHDLLEHDLSGFNVFAVPQTAALAEQKMQSLRGAEAWLLDCLQRGVIGHQEWTDAGVAITKADAHAAYTRTARDFREAVARDIGTWARTTKAALAECWQERKLWAGGNRTRQLVLASLTESRSAFERHLGHKIPWETDADAKPQGLGGGHAATFG